MIKKILLLILLFNINISDGLTNSYVHYSGSSYGSVSSMYEFGQSFYLVNSHFDSIDAIYIYTRRNSNIDITTKLYSTNSTGYPQTLLKTWTIPYSSIGIDSNNKDHISYFDSTNSQIRYVTNKTGSWSSPVC